MVNATELKAEIKQWEYAFRAKNGRNPLKDDIRADHYIYKRYQAYYRFKDQLRQDSFEVTSTPVKKPQLTHIGPTPQHEGRALGLFDVASPKMQELPTTPSKKRPDQDLSTPSKSLTPRTPGSTYFERHGHDSFSPKKVRSLSALMEGLKQKKLDEGKRLDDEIALDPALGSEVSSESGSEEEEEQDLDSKQPVRKKKGQKRTTRRVKMKPVTGTETAKVAKNERNYRRLKINHSSAFKRFKRNR